MYWFLYILSATSVVMVTCSYLTAKWYHQKPITLQWRSVVILMLRPNWIYTPATLSYGHIPLGTTCTFAIFSMMGVVPIWRLCLKSAGFCMLYLWLSLSCISLKYKRYVYKTRFLSLRTAPVYLKNIFYVYDIKYFCAWYSHQSNIWVSELSTRIHLINKCSEEPKTQRNIH